jgi:hypothetical protein
MPRYFFDLRDGDELAVDEEGLELKTVQAAQAEAAKSLADMARDLVHTTTSSSTHQLAIEVRDGAGPVMQVRFIFEVQTKMH